MLIGTWIVSGIVPAIMFYGLEFIAARWFLPTILLFCAAMRSKRAPVRACIFNKIG
jgi:NhaC family Na+:H+ antiporter